MYKETALWKKAFEKQNDSYDQIRENLEKAFMNARKNASYILDKIRKDFPVAVVSNKPDVAIEVLKRAGLYE